MDLKDGVTIEGQSDEQSDLIVTHYKFTIHRDESSSATVGSSQSPIIAHSNQPHNSAGDKTNGFGSSNGDSNNNEQGALGQDPASSSGDGSSDNQLSPNIHITPPIIYAQQPH